MLTDLDVLLIFGYKPEDLKKHYMVISLRVTRHHEIHAIEKAIKMGILKYVGAAPMRNHE